MRFKQYLTEQQLLEITIAHAASFAAELHQGQHRKGSGAPYITHPRGVYIILKKLGVKSKELLAAAYLHDTVEDTPTTYNKIKKEFGKGVADLVKEVSSNKKLIDIIGKDEYLTNKMIKMSNSGLILKLADRLHNLSDIMTSSKGFAEKIWNQTRYIISALRTDRNLNGIQKKLIRKIIKQLQNYKQYEI
jgi:(p)ppGpp synthase/HD superfamily hydrolase